jgi:hypothetical protein
MAKSTSSNFVDFMKEFPQLKQNFKALLASHYSWDILNSTLAKTEYQSPDLLTFD